MTDYEGLGGAFKHYLSVLFVSTMAFPFFAAMILLSLEKIPPWIEIPPWSIPAIGLISVLATFIYRARKGYSDTFKQEANFAFISIASIGLTLFFILVIFGQFTIPAT